MCVLLTPVLYCTTTVLIEVYLLCFKELVSLRELGKPTPRSEVSSPNSLYPKVVKRAHFGSALTGATNEFTTSNRKKNSYKTHLNFLIFSLKEKRRDSF